MRRHPHPAPSDPSAGLRDQRPESAPGRDGLLCFLDVREHRDWAAFRASPDGPRRLWLFTTRGERVFWDAAFADEDGLVFGCESAGAPDWLHAELSGRRLTLPQPHPEVRSLNLSTAAGVACYEALRQLRGGAAVPPA